MGMADRTIRKRRQSEAEAIREKEMPISFIPAKKKGEEGRFYARLRLQGPASWPEARKSCPARQGQFRGEVVGLNEEHNQKCQVCRSKTGKRVTVTIYCKDCHLMACCTACFDEYHGKFVHKTAGRTDGDAVITI